MSSQQVRFYEEEGRDFVTEVVEKIPIRVAVPKKVLMCEVPTDAFNWVNTEATEELKKRYRHEYKEYLASIEPKTPVKGKSK